MKKKYIEPSVEIFHMYTADGILQVTSSDAPDSSFDNNGGGYDGSDDLGSGEDLGRTNNGHNIWSQGW